MITYLKETLRLHVVDQRALNSYKYILEQVKDNKWIKVKRWEKHFTHGGPHIHIYDKNGFITKTIKDKERSLDEILKEIRKEYDIH